MADDGEPSGIPRDRPSNPAVDRVRSVLVRYPLLGLSAVGLSALGLALVAIPRALTSATESSWLPANVAQLMVVIGIIGAGALLFGSLLVAWLRVGRDPVAPLTDASVLLPGPPPGITPALAAALVHDAVDDRAFNAAVMELLVRGLIDIKVSARHRLSLLEGHDNDDKRPDIDVLVLDPPAAAPGAAEQPLGPPEQHLVDAIRKLAGPRRRLSGISLHSHASFDADIEAAINRTRLGQFRGSLAHAFVRRGAALALILGFVEDRVLHIWKHETPHIDPGQEFLVAPLAIGILLGLATAVLSSRVNRRTPAGAQALAMLRAYGNTLQMAGQRPVELDLHALSPSQQLPWDLARDDGLVWATALGLRPDFDVFMNAATSPSSDKTKGAFAAHVRFETLP
jgi:hypothetical protein